MESKFWQRDSSSSYEDDDEEDLGNQYADSGSEDETSRKPTAVVGRWANMEDSSSEDEEKRVVRSTKDKRWDQLHQTIKAMKNYKTIEDFGELQTGFDLLLKGIQKSKAIVDKEGIPPFVIRAMAELETYVADKYLDKESLKKFSKGKSISFNILRSKIRKGMEPFRALIDEYHRNPTAFEDLDEEDELPSDEEFSSDDDDDEEEEEENDDDDDDDENDIFSSSGSDELKDDDDVEEEKDDYEKSDDDSDSSTSYEGDEGKVQKEKTKKKKSSSEKDEDWEEFDYTNDMVEDGDDKAQQEVLKLWGKKEASGSRSKVKKSRKKSTRGTKVAKVLHEVTSQQPTYGRAKSAPILVPGERVDAELLNKKLKEVISLRGRKGFDRVEQIRHLNELATAAKQVSSQSYMEVLGHLISAYCDSILGAFVAMPRTQWVLAYEEIHNALNVLRREKDCYFSFLLTEDDDELYEGGNELTNDMDPQGVHTATSSTTSLLKSQRHQTLPGESKELKARLETALTLTRFLERIDDELMKFLQLTDIHSEDYKLGLRHTVDMVFLLWKAYMHFTRTSQEECARYISLRILEHIYYRSNNIASKMWEIIKKQLDSEDSELLSNATESPSDIVNLLVKCNLERSTCRNTNVRFVLYLAYSHSLHGRFYEACHLLQASNIHELASQCNIGTQIFYNRNLVQLGLAAFRQGLLNETHSYLSEVCAMGRYWELLAQGLSNTPKGMEKNFEQERLEKRRILPYHMHIASDLVEAVHNICAMLLEVPFMASNALDYSKKPIARNFRRLLEIYDRQMFTGPPENSRESIMAATKALQKGDWKLCATHIMSLKFWESVPDSEKVKEIITERIKIEALRTYILTYSSMYNSFSTKQLAEMFHLPTSKVHSCVSKMVIQGLLSGSWDEASECVLIYRLERTPLQRFALQLTEKISQAVDQNETVLSYRNPRNILTQTNVREDRTRRFDDRWSGLDRRGYGIERSSNAVRYVSGTHLSTRSQGLAVGATKRRW